MAPIGLVYAMSKWRCAALNQWRDGRYVTLHRYAFERTAPLLQLRQAAHAVLEPQSIRLLGTVPRRDILERPRIAEVVTTLNAQVMAGEDRLDGVVQRVVIAAIRAVNPNLTAEAVGDIAIASTDTARAFEVEPRVAMLSYSTGTSGKGPTWRRCGRRPASCGSGARTCS